MNEQRVRSTEAGPPPTAGLPNERTLFTPCFLGTDMPAIDVAMRAPATTEDEPTAIPNEPPRLTLVFPDDRDELHPASADGAAGPVAEQAAAGVTPLQLAPLEEDAEIEKFLLWTPGESGIDRVSSHSPRRGGADALGGLNQSFAGAHFIDEHDHFSGDHSAVDEIALHNPLDEASLESAAAAVFGETPAPVAMEPLEVALPEDPSPAEISLVPLEETFVAVVETETKSAASVPRSVRTPPAIGSGRLIPAKLTWKPGDPFAAPVIRGRRFRWDLMLTTACLTALCGLTAMWLLRAVLA